MFNHIKRRIKHRLVTIVNSKKYILHRKIYILHKVSTGEFGILRFICGFLYWHFVSHVYKFKLKASRRNGPFAAPQGAWIETQEETNVICWFGYVLPDNLLFLIIEL